MREIRVGGRIVPETLCRARLFRVCVNCRHSPTVIPAKAGIHLDFFQVSLRPQAQIPLSQE
jgi:hypothetical protein